MQGWTNTQMEMHVNGPKEGKKAVLLACIRRKESERISTTTMETRRPPDAVRGWLARGMDRGPYDLDEHKQPGGSPMLDHVVETLRVVGVRDSGSGPSLDD